MAGRSVSSSNVLPLNDSPALAASMRWSTKSHRRRTRAVTTYYPVPAEIPRPRPPELWGSFEDPRRSRVQRRRARVRSSPQGSRSRRLQHPFAIGRRAEFRLQPFSARALPEPLRRPQHRQARSGRRLRQSSVSDKPSGAQRPTPGVDEASRRRRTSAPRAAHYALAGEGRLSDATAPTLLSTEYRVSLCVAGGRIASRSPADYRRRRIRRPRAAARREQARPRDRLDQTARP